MTTRREHEAGSKTPHIIYTFYFPASAFSCRQMMLASARRESFTASALGNIFAASGSKTTTFAPRW